MDRSIGGGGRRTAIMLSLLALAVALATLVALVSRPTAALSTADGLYRSEGDVQPFRWTSSQVTLPIHGRSGATRLRLTLGALLWPGRDAPTAHLASERGLVALPITEQPRQYHLLLAAGAEQVTLHTPVAQPPGDDPRWLGVQLFALEAAPEGLPIQALVLALATVPATLLLALVGRWSLRRGYGLIAAVTALGLLLRVAWLRTSPPGFNQDEVISIVDAWHLLHTGRDHLGHLLPLGSFEAYGDWISPLLTWLEVPSVALLGPGPLAGRLVTALVGTLAIPALYGVARMLRLPWPIAVLVALVAALSPWQIFLSRAGKPPALVPVAWAICLWAALRLVQRSDRRAACGLALAAGLGLYAYPTLKMAIPLLTALALVLALLSRPRDDRWRALRAWLPAGLLLALLWLPFVSDTLFNPASATRLNQTALKAASTGEWLARWARGYRDNLGFGFIYRGGDGDPVHGVPGYGLQLPLEAPLALLGLGLLLWKLFDRRAAPQPGRAAWWLIAGALVLAPLPASLTIPSPHTFRAATLAPLLALLVGLGALALWQITDRLLRTTQRTVSRAVHERVAGAALIGLALLLAIQSADWLRAYGRDYPRLTAHLYQDGLHEALRRAIRYATTVDEVWIDTDETNEPYSYLLAAEPLPPAEAQARLVVERRPRRLHAVTEIGQYHFGSLAALPTELPVIEAVPDQAGALAFVLQPYQQAGKRVLLVRRPPR